LYSPTICTLSLPNGYPLRKTKGKRGEKRRKGEGDERFMRYTALPTSSFCAFSFLLQSASPAAGQKKVEKKKGKERKERGEAEM